MSTAALVAAIATSVLGALALVGRFNGQETPVNPVAAHSSAGLTGVIFWWLYTSGEGERGRSVGALVGGFALIVTWILGAILFRALRGSFGSERRPPRSTSARVWVFLHGVAASVTIVLVCIEVVDAWHSYSGKAPGIPTRSDIPATVLFPVWLGVGLVLALCGHLVFRKRLGEASMIVTVLSGAIAATVAGAIGYYGAGLSAPLTIAAAALGALFGWWWRLISFAGVDADEDDDGMIELQYLTNQK